MTPYHTEPLVDLYLGDCLSVMATLPAGSVHACVYSPPYFALRSYSRCPCGSGPLVPGSGRQHLAELGERLGTGGGKSTSQDPRGPAPDCTICRGTGEVPGMEQEIGSEPTPEAWIATMVDVARAVRRVLRDDGTLWVNVGDSYASSGGHTAQGATSQRKGRANVQAQNAVKGYLPKGMQSGQLLGLPWRMALALQADGWILRSDIIWRKVAPLPESIAGTRFERCRVKVKSGSDIKRKGDPGESGMRSHLPQSDGGYKVNVAMATWRDCPGCAKCSATGGLVLRRGSWRPTRAHEYIFQFAKGPGYFCDGEAVRSATRPNTLARGTWAKGEASNLDGKGSAWAQGQVAGANPRSVWSPPPERRGGEGIHFACVDEDTEALTSQGWKRQHELTDGDSIAAFDGEALMWKPATFHRYDYHGTMIAVETRDLSMLLTPNHRVVRRRYNKKHLPWSVRRADELTQGQEVPTSAPFSAAGGRVNMFAAEMAGWILTDGSYNSGLRITLYQTEGRGKHERIEELLANLRVKYHLYQRTRRGKRENAYSFGGTLARWLRRIFPRKEGNWDVLARWDEQSLRCLWNGMTAGDGNRRKDGRVTFVGNRVKVDFYQALSLRLGMTCRVTYRQGKAWAAFVSAKHATSLRGTNGAGKVISKREYRGVVWCPSVASGMWLARRNGRPFITGNTYPTKLIEPIVKAAVPAEACATCGAPWAPVLERGGGSTGESWHDHDSDGTKGQRKEKGDDATYYRRVTGYLPTCAHPGEPVPGTILDPFSGTATTSVVARRLGRRSIGIELSPVYMAAAVKRLQEADAGASPAARLAPTGERATQGSLL